MIRAKREPRLDVKQTAFPFQVEAVEAIKDLEYAAIFHEQGLGKTKIAIDLAIHWLRAAVVDSVLVVTKKSLVENWKNELSLHSYVRPAVLTQDRGDNFFLFNAPVRVYLAHYEVCESEAVRLRLFLKTRKVGVILDEAQKIKNPESAVAQSLMALAPLFTRRVIMTGTPVANRPYDIWAQVKFLDGGKALGDDFSEFRARLNLTSDLAHSAERRAELEDGLSAVFPKIASFSVRETKKTAGITLPNKEISSVQVEMEERQGELYGDLQEKLCAYVVREGLPSVERVDDVLKRLLRLVQVASNPRLIDEGYDREPGKLPALRSLLDTAFAAGSKVIVWTSFTENADWLARQLRSDGAVRVHGKMAIADRNRALARFKEDATCRVLVATPGAAKEGLTLTVANYAVFFDRSFSLDDYLQAQDRIHRISQARTCYVYNLIARQTVDEWVDELLGAKHLAAQLTQGDIKRDEYSQRAEYSFVEVLEKILDAGRTRGRI